MSYPNAILSEESVTLTLDVGSIVIPADWIEGSPKIASEDGRFHRLTLTLFVESIHLGHGVIFDGEKSR